MVMAKDQLYFVVVRLKAGTNEPECVVPDDNGNALAEEDRFIANVWCNELNRENAASLKGPRFMVTKAELIL